MSDRTVSAPALEKGLDLLEALAEEPAGLSQKAVAERVGRSVNEIFRMLGVLEKRGYVARDQRGQYALTLRLFELAHRHPPEKRLLEAGMQAMEELSADIGHASHLVVMHGGRLMVLAQAQPDSILMGWSVRLGAVFPLSEKYVSARVISAFQRPDRQEELVQAMTEHPDASPPDVIREKLRAIAKAGHDCSPSQVAFGVKDVSCPVLNHFGHAVAALTVPYMHQPDVPVTEERLIEAVQRAAERISVSIGAGKADMNADEVWAAN
jgi:DNA-binding IclR family transcriptional regulator